MNCFHRRFGHPLHHDPATVRPKVVGGGTNDETYAPSAPAVFCHKPAQLDPEVRHWASILHRCPVCKYAMRGISTYIHLRGLGNPRQERSSTLVSIRGVNRGWSLSCIYVVRYRVRTNITAYGVLTYDRCQCACH